MNGRRLKVSAWFALGARGAIAQRTVGGGVFALAAALGLGLGGCASDRASDRMTFQGPATSSSTRSAASATSAAAADPMSAGRDAMAEGNATAAAAEYTRALQLNPNDPVALNNLAVAKASSGDYQSALDLLRRAAASAPDRADIAANLAHYQAWFDQRATVPLESPGLDSAVDPDVVKEQVPALWGTSGQSN